MDSSDSSNDKDQKPETSIENDDLDLESNDLDLDFDDAEFEDIDLEDLEDDLLDDDLLDDESFEDLNLDESDDKAADISSDADTIAAAPEARKSFLSKNFNMIVIVTAVLGGGAIIFNTMLSSPPQPEAVTEPMASVEKPTEANALDSMVALPHYNEIESVNDGEIITPPEGLLMMPDETIDLSSVQMNEPELAPLPDFNEEFSLDYEDAVAALDETNIVEIPNITPDLEAINKEIALETVDLNLEASALEPALPPIVEPQAIAQSAPALEPMPVIAAEEEPSFEIQDFAAEQQEAPRIAQEAAAAKAAAQQEATRIAQEAAAAKAAAQQEAARITQEAAAAKAAAQQEATRIAQEAAAAKAAAQQEATRIAQEAAAKAAAQQEATRIAQAAAAKAAAQQEATRIAQEAAAAKVVKKAPAPAKPSASAKDWVMKSAQPDRATIQNKKSHNVLSIKTGDKVDGIGVVQSIALQNGLWTIQGSKGVIAQ